MRERSTVFLMYHELEVPGRTLCHPEPGYVRYAVAEQEFRGQIEFLKQRGYKGSSVGQALEFTGEKCVAMTFDDGSETDLLAAAPILRNAGFSATFYITVGWLGRPGHLSGAQVNELSGQGFEIGCHSMTHAYLTDLDDRGLQREIADAKSQLEEIIGRTVAHFSCPGGRHDDRVAEVAREAGYQTVATSAIRANSRGTSRYALGRVALLRGMPLEDFSAVCSGEALPKLRRRSMIRDSVRQVLGNTLYDQIRELLLRG